jgi:glycogen(starch) synthase
MKVVHLASEFPPARIFGLGRYVHDLARAQVRRGHEVHVLTNSLSGKDLEAQVHGIRVHRIHFPSPPMPADGATQVTQFNICVYERAVELARSLASPTAVVAHDWLTVLAAHAVRQRLGGRLILTMHDTVVGKTFGKMNNEDKFVGLIERWGCQVADSVIAVSRHVRDELVGPYEAPPQKLTVAPCGVDSSWFESVAPQFLPDLRAALATPNEKLVAFVGRLDPEKGVEHLLEAFSLLLSDHEGLRLVIAGKGQKQQELETLAERLGILPRTRFLGYVAGPALEALLKVSDVLACPSTYEPFGIVPLEGMVNRLPVVVSDTGGMAEIIEHGKSGLKVPPGDPRALAGAIGYLLGKPFEAKRLAKGGYERAKSIYSWDQVALKVDAIYAGAAAASHESRPPRPGRQNQPRLKLTAGIRVKNGERYAEECLHDLSAYVDEIVILDDGSTDRTADICRSFPKVTQYVRWEKSFFHEGIDRNVVLALAKNTDPAWILLPDIDEVFEDRFKDEVRRMMASPDVDLFAFLFCHFWRSRTHYRVDGKWGRETRSFPIPRLVRSLPSLHYPVHRPLGTAQITGVPGRAVVSDIRVKHYGHLYEDVSREKVRLYSSLDPGADYSYMTDEVGLELEEWKESASMKLEVVR